MPAPRPRRVRRTDTPPPPLLQIMPGRRVRLDPTQVESIATWLIAAAAPWERGTARSILAVPVMERDAAIGHRQWCRHACSAIQSLVSRLTDTVALDEIDTARDLVRADMARVPPGVVDAPGGDVCDAGLPGEC